MSIKAFWQAVLQRLDAGRPVFVSLVVANTHGSPGTLGARLLADPEGGAEGTIGGGIMETNLIADARRLLALGRTVQPSLQRLVHRKKKDTRYASGLICAGEQTNLNLVLDPLHDVDAIRRFCHAIADQDHSAATLTIGAQGLEVTPNEDAGDTPGLQLLRDGNDWHYRESSTNPQRLAIIGGGHCGKALARLAASVGDWVDVFDIRPEVLEGDDWPSEVRRQTLADYAELDARLRHPALTTVVVMTTAVNHDITALASVASTPLRWLGVMGSVAKIHEIRTQLGKAGIDQDHINAIHGPIGLPMKSDTPPEIAISIMGQLLAARDRVH